MFRWRSNRHQIRMIRAGRLAAPRIISHCMKSTNKKTLQKNDFGRNHFRKPAIIQLNWEMLYEKDKVCILFNFHTITIL